MDEQSRDMGTGRERAISYKEMACSYKARAGAAVASVSFLTLTSLLVFRVVETLRPHLGWYAGGLGLLGLVLLFASLPYCKRSGTEEQVLEFYHRPSFWGGCLITAAVVIFVLATLLFPVLAVDPPVSEMALPPQPAAIEFPDLVVTGVILNGTQSSAIIDGQTVMMGERLDKVTVVDVYEDGIITELEGERRRYRLHLASPMTIHPDDPICNGNLATASAPRSQRRPFR